MVYREGLVVEVLALVSVLLVVANTLHIVYNWRRILGLYRLFRETEKRDLPRDKRVVVVSACRVSATDPLETGLFIETLDTLRESSLVERVFVIVDSLSEREYLERTARGAVEVLLSREGLCEKCSGKNRALVTGLREVIDRGLVDDYTDILFLDCDAYFPRLGPLLGSLGALVSGRRALVTGYRWYVLSDLPGVLYNTVSTMFFETLFSEKTTIVWGGFMYTRSRDVCIESVIESLSREVADDAVVRRELSGRGVEILFCPQCIGVSRAPRGPGWLRDFVSWASRQMLMVRIYTPRGFRYVYIGYVAMALAMLSPLLLVLADPVLALYTALLVTTPMYISGVARASLLVLFYMRALGVYIGERPYIVLYILLGGLRSLVAVYVMTAALYTRRFAWRGRSYCVERVGERLYAVPCV